MMPALAFNFALQQMLEEETIGHCTAAPQLTFVPQKCVDMQTDDRLLIGEARSGTSSDIFEKISRSSISSDFNIEKSAVSATSRHNKAITIAEENWKNRTNLAVQHRQRLFEEHTAQLELTAKHQLQQIYLVQEDKASRHTSELHKNNKESTEKVYEKQEQIKEKHKKHAQWLSSKMVEAHRKQQEEEENQRKRLADSKKNLNAMLDHQKQLLNQLQHANQLLLSCVYPQHLHASALGRPALLAQVASTVDEFVTAARQNEVTNAHLEVVRDFCLKAQDVTDYIASQVEEANKKGKEEEAKLQQRQQEKQQQLQDQQAKEKELQKQVQASSAAQTSAASTSQPTTATTSTATKQSVPTGPKYESVDPDVLKYYTDLQQKLDQFDNDCKPILDPQFKKLRFDLQKTVNTAINAISPTSGSHLRDKWNRLVTLISGKPLQTGSSVVNASVHPSGIPFCKQLIAKKIVIQGEEQVSSSSDSAFAIAAVAVGIWHEYPDVGELMLAYFYKKCPYLAPYYIPKQDDQSTDEYYKRLGYLYEDGTCEKQDKFLKRMTGMVKLYCAIVVTNPPIGLRKGQQRCHPHGLENVWTWIVRVLNLPPRPDVTPTVLLDVLQVTGSTMLGVYHKQIIKLLQLILLEYLPKMRAIGGSGGPVTRIDSFLQQCIQQKSISPPKGMISPQFWSS